MQIRPGVSDTVFGASLAVVVIAFAILSLGLIGVLQSDQAKLQSSNGSQTTITKVRTVTAVGTTTTGPGTDPWTPAASMNVARSFAAVAALTNGSVLIAGGFAGAVANSSIISAEIYHPGTDKWTMVAPMHVGRAGARASTLANGEVLVDGGLGAQGPLASSEIFNPKTDSWAMVNSTMIAATFDQQQVTLNNGEVLVVGGDFSGGENNVTQIYNPGSGQWTRAAPQPLPRADMIGVKLADGNVLVAGGHTAEAPTLLSAVYNPTTNTWTETGPLKAPGGDSGGVLLRNGAVLMAGGYTTYNDSDNTIQYLYTSEVFNATTNSWKMSGDLNYPRGEVGLSTVLLNNGEVLIPGGNYQPETGLDSAEIYTPSSGHWALAGTTLTPHGEGAMAVLLENGEVLAVGGLLPHACLFCGSANPGQDLSTNAADLFNINATGVTTSTTTTTTAIAGVEVTMPSGVGTSQTLTFSPVNIKVVIGVNNTVTWINQDGVPHTVTSSSVPSGASMFNSGNMNPGATFTMTFTVAGTYGYYCQYHNWMKGTVTVITG